MTTGTGGMGNIYGGGSAQVGVTLSSSMPTGGGTSASSSSNQKHDIFVGNLSFNTTEEQLHVAFSEVGRVINVRMVTDQDTGKPRGFAFVEFEQAQAALSAIRNMNDYELNGRRLRVNFSNSSHLEALAGKLGMDLSQQTGKQTGSNIGSGASGNHKGSSTANMGTNAVVDALKGLSKGEMYDVVAKLKEIAERDPDEARRMISGHPQLPEALLFLMSKLDMIKTPLPAASESMAGGSGGVLMPSITSQLPPVRAADPRAAAASTVIPLARADPRQQQQTVTAPPAVVTATRMDPRQQQQRAADPRAAAAAAAATAAAARVPPPPPPPPRMVGQPPAQQQQQQAPPPPVMAQSYLQQQQPQQQSSLANLDPALVQQVLSLTPQQIQQLPPDKQQSILQLRQQITGSM